MASELRITIDSENQTVEIIQGVEPFDGHWVNGMPGDGALYYRGDRVVGVFLPIRFGSVIIEDAVMTRNAQKIGEQLEVD